MNVGDVHRYKHLKGHAPVPNKFLVYVVSYAIPIRVDKNENTSSTYLINTWKKYQPMLADSVNCRTVFINEVKAIREEPRIPPPASTPFVDDFHALCKITPAVCTQQEFRTNIEREASRRVAEEVRRSRNEDAEVALRGRHDLLRENGLATPTRKRDREK